MKWSMLALLVFCGAAFAGDIKPYQAQQITPYKAREIQPYTARQIKPSQEDAAIPQQAQDVKSGQPAAAIEPYKAREARRYTKEDFARMNKQTDEEAKRIARQRGSAQTPDQLYWQQQIMHRQMEATNPDITYRGR